ncbi:MULE transposase [Hirsutella rhossiliensis]
MTDVDEFWHRERQLRGSSPNDAPLDPLPVRGKGRPKGSSNLEKGACSTRRKPSAHEIVERIERAEAIRPPLSTAPAALTSTKKHEADSKAGGKGRGRGSSTAVNAADVTRQALEYIYANGDSYEPGTEMPRAYQRHRTPDSDNELAGAGETQGTIHCYQATQQATQWNTQRITMPSTHRGHKEEDTEDEDDPLADFDMMDEEMEEEECLREELHKEGLL